MPAGTAQLNAVMYFKRIQQDATGFQSVDGGIVQGAFFRRGAREQNEAMRSICSFVEVGQSHVVFVVPSVGTDFSTPNDMRERKERQVRISNSYLAFLYLACPLAARIFV